MKDSTVAGRYARALFIVTEKRGETERALEDVKGVAGVIGARTHVADLLATPQVPLADKRRVVQASLENRALRSVMLFIDLLLRKKRLGDLEGIVAAFEDLVERKQGVRRAQVVSAVPLLPEEFERLHRELEAMLGATVRLDASVDPALLGGALVRVGDRVIDRTARTLLESIEEQLMRVPV